MVFLYSDDDSVETAEAERVATWLKQRNIFASNDYDFRMMILEYDGPVVRRYLASGSKELARRRAEYVRP